MDRYTDGKLWMSHVTLRPAVRFAGTPCPDAAALATLHHAAHTECFIARSVTGLSRCSIPPEPRPPGVSGRRAGGAFLWPMFTELLQAEVWRKKLEAAGFRVLPEAWERPKPAKPVRNGK